MRPSPVQTILDASERGALRMLARLDAEMIGRRRLGRAGALRVSAARRACLDALPRPLLDCYFDLVRRRCVPAVVLASRDACGGCRARLAPEITVRLASGAVVACPACERLLVRA